jgi:hypothetical protein
MNSIPTPRGALQKRSCGCPRDAKEYGQDQKKDEPWLKGRCAGSRKMKKVNLHLTGVGLVCSIFDA